MRSRIFLAFLLVFCTFVVFGQVDRASLNGTITDPSGAVVPGAKIVVFAPVTGLRRETLAGTNGVYNFPGLPIGIYDVTVSSPGLETVEMRGLTLSVGQVATYDARLTPGAVKTQVEVTGQAVEVNRTSAEVGGVVGAQQVRSIPLNG